VWNAKRKRQKEKESAALFRGERSNVKSDRTIKEFLAEAEDNLESANQALSSLENARAAGRNDPDQVNALFRAVHSFKGLAGMFGLQEPSALSHKMEFLLDELRLGRVELSAEALDALCETTTVLRRLVRQSGENQLPEDITPALERIDAILKAKPVTVAERPLGEQVALDPGILQVLTEYEEHRLRECLRARRDLFSIKAVFQLADFETAIRDLNVTLKQHGEIICTLPTAGGEGGGIGFTIIVAAAGDPGLFETVFTRQDVTIKRIASAGNPKAEDQRADADLAALKSVSNTVRVDIYKLDNLMNIVGEMHQAKNIIGRISRELHVLQATSGLAVDLQKAERGLTRKLNDLQNGILDARMVPIGQIFTRLSQMVKKYARDAGKEIELRLQGEETELDKLMMEDLADPLMHLIRNAIDHGIEDPAVRKKRGKPEVGTVMLTAFPKGNHVVITVEDDGAGIDPRRLLATAIAKGTLGPSHGLDPEQDRKEIFDLIYTPGFTTRETVTELSGRGVGMDVVKRNVSKLSGMIDIQSELGSGTVFTLTLPITLAIIKALIIETGGRVFAIPLNAVIEVLQTAAADIETIEGREVTAVRDDTIPLLRLARAFHLPEDRERTSFSVVLVGLAERRLGIMVDTLRDQQEIVVKTLGKRLADVQGIAGATELGDQRGVVLVLDVESLIEGALRRAQIARA
jgi:two-component system chemotaxis sensor kinase CheA